MPEAYNPDATPGEKLLRMYNKLMLDGKRHFQMDLARELECSPQTVARLALEIENVIGTANLNLGLEGRKRWYQMESPSRKRLGLSLQYEELRYLGICRDLAEATLPRQIRERVDATIFSLAVLMADNGAAGPDGHGGRNFNFFQKGRIDYSPHYEHIEKLLQAALERRVCLMRYQKSGAEQPRDHRFAPGRIVSMNGALYALGATVTEDFADIRHLAHFAVQRIKDVILTEREFDFDLPEAEPGSFGLPWHEPRTFKIKFAPGEASDYVRERTWADEQELEEADDGGVILHITTRAEPELMAWVRSFGEKAVTVPTPKIS